MALVVYSIVARRGTIEFPRDLVVNSIAPLDDQAFSHPSIVSEKTMKVCNGVQTQTSVLCMAIARALCGASISRPLAIG